MAYSSTYNRRQNELRHFAQNLAFLRFMNFKRRKYCRAQFLILSFIETHRNKERSEKDRKRNRFLGIKVVRMAKIAL